MLYFHYELKSFKKPTSHGEIQQETMAPEFFKRLQTFKKISGKIIFPTSNELIAIYTILRILNKMKKVLGLEAMLEYIDYSLKTLEGQNKDLHSATTQVLEIMDINRIYQEVK